MKKKLSIITINYNNFEGLKRTVASVVNQTWKEFEFIVIDGGSTDGSTEYIKSQSDNFDYWVSENDSGIYNAMNKGIKLATGEYLLFLNSGDHFYSNLVLEKNNHFLNVTDLIYFNVQIIDNKAPIVVTYPDKIRFSDMFFSALCHQSTFIKKELFDTIGMYDETFRIVSDWKFTILALFKYQCSYLKINETISTYYLDGISSIEDFSHERDQVLQEYFSAYFLDYKQWQIDKNDLSNKIKILETNRFKMLLQIDKTWLGKKMASALFRIYIILFSKKKLKEILK